MILRLVLVVTVDGRMSNDKIFVEGNSPCKISVEELALYVICVYHGRWR